MEGTRKGSEIRVPNEILRESSLVVISIYVLHTGLPLRPKAQISIKQNQAVAC